MYTEVPRVLVSSVFQVQPQLMPDSDYLPNYPLLMTMVLFHKKKQYTGFIFNAKKTSPRFFAIAVEFYLGVLELVYTSN